MGDPPSVAPRGASPMGGNPTRGRATSLQWGGQPHAETRDVSQASGPPARHRRTAHAMRSVSSTRLCAASKTDSQPYATHAPHPRQTEAPVVHHDDWGFFMTPPFLPSCPAPSPLRPPPSASPSHPSPRVHRPRALRPRALWPRALWPRPRVRLPNPAPPGSSCQSDMTKPPFETTRLFQKVVLSQKWPW